MYTEPGDGAEEGEVPRETDPGESGPGHQLPRLQGLQ